MDPQPISSSGPAKRARFEIKTIFVVVLAVMVCGAIWVALNGSPTRSRAGIDSSANPTSTVAPLPTAPAAHP